MNQDLFVKRVFDKFDSIDTKLSNMTERIKELETIHQVTKDKFNQLMAVIGALGTIMGILMIVTR